MLNNIRHFPENPQHQAIRRSLAELQRDYTEREPRDAKVYFLDDLFIYRCWGILSKAERQLACDDPEGARMVQELVEKQWHCLKPLVQICLQEQIGARALGVSVTLSPEEDELVILCRIQQTQTQGKV